MSSLNHLKKRTAEVISKMPDNGSWTIHNRLAELMEEVGELANAIQTKEGFKSQRRKKSEVVDSVCDVLFEIFSIAEYYNIDLDKEYPEVLAEIDRRREKGEFEHVG